MVQDKYDSIWQYRGSVYPIILLDILNANNERCVTLYLNLRDWNYLPPSATLITLDLKQLITQPVIGAKTDKDPFVHVGYGKGNRPWFCNPGFLEYHYRYLDDRWEKIRYTEFGEITWVIEQACNLIDRKSLRML